MDFFNELNIFLAVAKNKSFSVAANELFISQSTVSSNIKSLEEKVGTPLFIRNRHKVEITKAGEIFLDFTHKINLTTKEVNSKLQLLLNGQNGELSIASSHTIFNWLLPEILTQFHYQYPEIQISISSSFTEDTIKKVVLGEAHFGFIRMTAPAFKDNRFFSKLLEDDETYFFTTPDNYIFNNKEITVGDLCKRQLIIYGSPTNYWPQLYSIFENAGVSPNVKMIVNDMQAVKLMVKLNKYIGFLPKLAIENELEQGVFKKIELIDCQPIKRYTFVICRKNIIDLPTEKNFINFINSKFV